MHCLYFHEKRNGEWFFTHREPCSCEKQDNHWQD